MNKYQQNSNVGIEPRSSSYGKITYLSMLNLFACICVVYLHCNGMVHTFSHGENWVLALAIECLGYCAVPIFFMLTGATLLCYRERYSTREYAAKRVRKTLVPFLAWNLIWYVVLCVMRDGEPFDPIVLLSRVMSNSVVDVYWFFFPLFAVYITIPFLSLLVDNRRALWGLVACSFLLGSLLPQVFSMFSIPWNYELGVPMMSGYLILVVLGHLLSTEDLDSRQRTLIYLVGALALAFKFAYTLLASEATSAYDKTLAGYTGFASVMQSVAVFVWFRYCDWSLLEKHRSLIAKLASCSFGVYLIHYPILHVVVFGWMGIPVTSVAFRLLGAAIFFVVILLAVLQIKRIPYLRELVP